ncbi:2,5-didehydrogluconate reductase [Schleiferilactobacillus perolens DSM 12744]|uniref:2,5-didehydrogluconate reductase n=2 Tax=Schleiferilactobacillus perolens TaxID=100468 RepID=A0A0R1MSX9_9LACO|nr:2,5-didehydrogluconate reductase [Schleiferilactobacillus perolens DSM 12744]
MDCFNNEGDAKMKLVTIAGRQVPAIGIGTWHMGSMPDKRPQEIAAIRAGIDAGARLVDTAEMYGSGDSEALVGEALQTYHRDDIFLISKVLPNNASKQRMEKSLEASLARLQTDYLDLYLYHWRGGVPLAETISELQRLQDSGKIRAWGVSNFDLPDMTELWQLPEGKNAVANEDLYNLAERGIEYDLLPWQRAHNIPLIAYSPVGAGADIRSSAMQGDTALAQVAAHHNVSPYQVILAWAIRDGHTIAIPQTSNAEHMKTNIAAGDVTLTDGDLALLDKEFPAPTRKEPLAMR